MIFLGTALIALVLALGRCGEPTIDGSSKEAMRKSISEIQANLNGEQKEPFNEAVQVVVFSGINFKHLFVAGQTGGASMEADILGKLDGKTAGQVIALRREKQCQNRKMEGDGPNA